ncbi:MAG: hypothetical protein QGG40_19890, partial [Myxococcota bacterium]|nr:hypothetical protein [Myxococcota bacterium]
WAFATIGALPLVVAIRAVLGRSGDETDAFLGLWLLGVVLGVVIGHNYASPRYLVSGLVPAALLVVRHAEKTLGGPRLLWIGTVLHALLATGLSVGEHRFHQAASELALQLDRDLPAERKYTGEWSFRWRLESLDWERFTGASESGDLLVAPVQSSPGPLPDGLNPLLHLESTDRFPLKVVHVANRTGLYAETLGALPLSFSRAPIEEVDVWQVP